MANAWENVSWIAEEALLHLEDALVISRLTARDKTSDFNVKPNGYAVGDTVDIKTRPDYVANEFTSTISTQDIRSSKRSMVIEKHYDISVAVTAKEKALNMDGFAAEVIIPAAYRLAEQCDIYIGTKILNSAGLFVTPSAEVLFSNNAAGKAHMINARKTANLQQLDPNNRWMIMDEDTEANLLLADWFTTHGDRGTTGEGIFNQAQLATTLGMSFFKSMNFPTATAATQGNLAATTDHVAAGIELVGTKLLPYDGGTGTTVDGDRLTVAGMNRPLVVDGVNTGASGNIALRDPITEAVPDNAAITTIGSAGDLTWHAAILDSTSIAVAYPILDPASDKPSSVVNNNGFSLRVVQGYDMSTKTDTLSMDILLGAEAYDPRRITVIAQQA